MKIFRRIASVTLSVMFILQCIPSPFVFANELSETKVFNREPANEYERLDDTERITSVDDTEFYYYSNGNYNFVLQKSAYGYIDFAIYYIDENVVKTGDFYIEDAVYEDNILKINGLREYNLDKEKINISSSSVQSMGIREISQLILVNIDENVEGSYSPEIAYSEMKIDLNQQASTTEDMMVTSGPPYSSYKEAAEAFCGTPYTNRLVG